MPSPTFEQLQNRLVGVESSAVSFEGVVYRSSTPKYATEADLLTGEGSRRFGGRWNPVGIAAVYACLTPETAMAEALAYNRYYGLPIEDAMPRTFVAVRARLKMVLDLRNGAVRRRLQLSETRILTLDWRRELREGREPVTQRLGRAAHAGRWEGLIVPSAADQTGHNLLIFPDRLASESALGLVNPDRLT
jgi:RES domain-containing protein